jgi:DNA-binding PadR family transcriptional regulator
VSPSLWWHVRRRIVAWWRRPPARDRALVELLARGEPTAGRDIAAGAEIWAVYPVLHRLEDEGLVASEFDPQLTIYAPDLGRHLRRKRYWLTSAGRARALEVPSW